MAGIDASDRLEYVFSAHTYHAFKKQQPQNSLAECMVCEQLRTHDIHKVEWATENRRKVHDFYPVRTIRNDAPLCLYCDAGETYYMHQNGSALYKGNPSTSLPDPPQPTPVANGCIECGHIADEPKSQTRTIAQEASDIVYGAREEAYDDPNVNFEKLALMWTAVLLRKLKPGVQVSARDTALMQVCLKIARESFRPKRDNRVDMIGYTLCLQRIVAREEDDDEMYQYEDDDEYNSENDDE